MSYDLVGPAADYPEWQGSPLRSLVICTQQRCGSTLLGEAVFSAGALGCPLEYFHSGFRPAFAARWNATDLPTYVAAVHRHRTDPSGTFAVKLFWRDVVDLVRECAPDEFAGLSWPTPAPMPPRMHRRILAALSSLVPNPTFVLLGRRDQIGQAISLYRAGETGSWRKFAEDAKGGEPGLDFHLIFRILAAIQSSNAHWLDFLRVNDASYHALEYEDLALSYEATLARFFAAIGRPDARIAPPRLRKQADGHSETLVRQFIADAREMMRRQ